MGQEGRRKCWSAFRKFGDDLHESPDDVHEGRDAICIFIWREVFGIEEGNSCPVDYVVCMNILQEFISDMYHSRSVRNSSEFVLEGLGITE